MLRRVTKISRVTAITCLLTLALPPATFVNAQADEETFTATATVQSAGGATATAPVTIVVSRKTPTEETDRLAAAFKTGGAAGLRKVLSGVPPTGSVRIGSRTPTPTRLTLERATDKGRLLTIVADQPLVFLGASLPGAKPREGYDFAILDLLVDAAGNGSGTLAPAAKVKLQQGAFVVDDYGGEIVRLNGVKRVQ